MKRGATLATLRLLAVVSTGMLMLELWAWLDVQSRDEVARVKLETVRGSSPGITNRFERNTPP